MNTIGAIICRFVPLIFRQHKDETLQGLGFTTGTCLVYNGSMCLLSLMAVVLFLMFPDVS